MRLTIITPTYNRGDKLNKLYESLIAQTVKGFEWLIIDDGSTDDTKASVQKFIQDADFPIRYESQENGGKHRALNHGIEMIDSELTFIVDSDDWLSKDCVATIFDYADRYADRRESDRLCGYSFLRAYSNGEVNTGLYPVDGIIDTYRQQRINNNLLGDKAEVYYTDILKKYPFEEFQGEKFMPEDAVWLKMSGPYDMVHVNRIIYYCDYLEGGLTKSGRKMKVNSPYGMMYRSSVYLNDPDVNLKPRIKMAILYNIYAGYARNKDKKSGNSQELIYQNKERCQVTNLKSKFLIKAALIPSKIIYMIWRRQYPA